MNKATEINESTALAIPAGTELVAMFKQPEAVDKLIDRIESEVRSHAPDLSTAKGRKAIASLAYKVAQSKSALDDAGKKLNEGLRSQISIVDAERRKIRERLDALKDEVRQPLTEWEAKEEQRVAELKARLERLAGASVSEKTSEAYHALIARVEAVAIDDTWQEFLPEAAQAKDATLARLRNGLAAAETREAEQAELARLRAEAEARAEADRLRAQQEAEAKAKAEAERAEAERQARIEKDKQEAAEQAAREAEARAKAEAEAEAKAARDREEQLKRQLAEAKEREERAAQAERDRIEAERKAEAEARAKREKDAKHRARIQGEIAEALEAYEAAGAVAMADAIIGGAIPHVRAVL